MAHFSFALAVVVAGLSSGDASSAPQPSDLIVGQGKFGPDESVGFCGAMARAGQISGYFDQVRADLRTNNIRNFDKYYASKVALGYHHKTLNLAKSRVVKSAALRLSLKDWQKIGDLSRTGLGSGGFRGCFLNGGKAFFSIQDDGELKLTAFDKDRPWGRR